MADGRHPSDFIGNTAEKILDEVDCSVLTVKPETFGSPVKRSSRRLSSSDPILLSGTECGMPEGNVFYEFAMLLALTQLGCLSLSSLELTVAVV